MASSHFAIVAAAGDAIIYQTYLHEKKIKFKAAAVANYEIFWNFTGDGEEINSLRFLIPAAS
tara:strand:- start:355 stop:540 length:186 start_codon:yes stop_codon:yes gene_type:complete